MTLAQLIPYAINTSLFALVFALGLKTTTGDVLYVLRRQGRLVRSILAMNVIMLALALAVALLLPVAPAIKIALIVLAASPVPPILPAKQTKAGGTVSYAVGLLVAASIMAIVIVPASVELTGSIFNADYHMPARRVVPVVLLSVIAPLVLGIAVKHVMPALADRIARPISIFATALLGLACLPVIFTSWPAIWALVGNGVFAILLLFATFGIAVGHLLGGPDPDDRTVLALATSTRHPGMAIAIANANVPDEKAVLAVVLWHLIVGAVVAWPYVNWRKRTHANMARAASR